MIKNKKILVIITARGGSKGIPRKNIKLLNGKPLISYAIRAALKSKFADRVIVSTDNEEIAKISKKYGAEVPFMRPAELARDNTPSLPVVQHAVNYMEEKENFRADLVVLLQPTSPLMLTEDIDNAIQKLIQTRANSCASVCEITERPEMMYFLKKESGGKIKPFLKRGSKKIRRQDLPKIYRLSGAVWVMKRDSLMRKNKILDKNNASAIVMPKERSIEIDEPIDFYITETIINKYKYN